MFPNEWLFRNTSIPSIDDVPSTLMFVFITTGSRISQLSDALGQKLYWYLSWSKFIPSSPLPFKPDQLATTLLMFVSVVACVCNSPPIALPIMMAMKNTVSDTPTAIIICGALAMFFVHFFVFCGLFSPKKEKKGFNNNVIPLG